jgi:hypothetical protein
MDQLGFLDTPNPQNPAHPMAKVRLDGIDIDSILKYTEWIMPEEVL